MILSLDIPPLAKQYAWLFLRQNNMGQRGTFDGTKEQQYTGLLGEICFKRLTTGLWPMLESGYDGGFDLTLDNRRVDVKTMGRNVRVRPDFVHNFVMEQANLAAETLIFQSLVKKTSTIELCGWINKSEALGQGEIIPKGATRTRKDGTTFTTGAELLEVPQAILKPFSGHLNIPLEESRMVGPLFPMEHLQIALL